MSQNKGFIDLQVNGYKGIDFSGENLTHEDVRSVTRELIARGTVAYCPTVCTSPMDVYQRNLGIIADVMKEAELGGHIIGVHLEGPFISPKPGAVGAHRADCVRVPSIEDFDLFMKWSEGHISILTLAPEEAGAEELIRHAKSQGVTVLLGHHLSDNESMAKAVAAGAEGCTHLGNALPNEIHRHKNPLWWQLACDDLWGNFITDGHHLPAEFIKVALRSKTLERFVVTSDVAAIAGMPPGVYGAFGKEVQVEECGRISVPSTGGLGGSGSTMIECMNFLASLNLLTEEELWRVSFDNPLKLLGISADSLKITHFSGVAFNSQKEFQLL